MRPNPRSRPHHQSGIVMVVALVMLVLITLLGLTSVRTLTIEEKMASNSYDRNIAFQAAEKALAEAETNLTLLPALPPAPNAADACDAPNCVGQLCTVLPTTCATPLWKLDKDDPVWQAATKPDSALVGDAPRYTIEYLGPSSCDPANATPTCSFFRITAVSEPGAGRAAVTLQSIFMTD